jgi:thiaminase
VQQRVYCAGMQEASKAYCAFMQRIGNSSSYTLQLATYWAIEWVYNKAWQLQHAMPNDSPYKECQLRWGNANFTAFVTALSAAVDSLLQTATAAELASVQEAFHDVMAFEIDFWQMAYSVTAANK